MRKYGKCKNLLEGHGDDVDASGGHPGVVVLEGLDQLLHHRITLFYFDEHQGDELAKFFNSRLSKNEALAYYSWHHFSRDPKHVFIIYNHHIFDKNVSSWLNKLYHQWFHHAIKAWMEQIMLSSSLILLTAKVSNTFHFVLNIYNMFKHTFWPVLLFQERPRAPRGLFPRRLHCCRLWNTWQYPSIGSTRAISRRRSAWRVWRPPRSREPALAKTERKSLKFYINFISINLTSWTQRSSRGNFVNSLSSSMLQPACKTKYAKCEIDKTTLYERKSRNILNLLHFAFCHSEIVNLSIMKSAAKIEVQ